MYYDGYHFWGMHVIWWLVWLTLLIMIFVSPYNLPFQRTKKASALYILQQRLASGQISLEEFQERKELLEDEKSRWGF